MSVSRRKHSDVLIAGLILVGVVFWIGGMAATHFDLGQIEGIAVWFLAACAAAQIARRLLVDLDFGETAIAAAVSIAIVAGIESHRNGEALNADLLLAIGVAEAGAIVGALTSRRRRDQVARIWLVLGGAFGGYGAAVLAIGATMLATDSIAAFGAAFLAGATVGAVIVALFTNVRGRHCALGLAVVFGVFFATAANLGPISGGLLGLGLGAVLGAIGGGIGGRINESRSPAPKLPEAHVR